MAQADSNSSEPSVVIPPPASGPFDAREWIKAAEAVGIEVRPFNGSVMFGLSNSMGWPKVEPVLAQLWKRNDRIQLIIGVLTVDQPADR